jgi:hypothetical protein
MVKAFSNLTYARLRCPTFFGDPPQRLTDTVSALVSAAVSADGQPSYLIFLNCVGVSAADHGVRA